MVLIRPSISCTCNALPFGKRFVMLSLLVNLHGFTTIARPKIQNCLVGSVKCSSFYTLLRTSVNTPHGINTSICGFFSM